MKIVLATGNSNKINEIKEILSGLDITFLTLKDYPDVPSIIEDGKSYIENAAKKAKHVARYTGEIALADDSGLEVDFLGNGRPGIYSARFAGDNAADSDNIKKMLSLMSGLTEDKRKARFVCVIVLSLPSGEIIKTAEGRCEGIIAESEQGTHGFGYDPIFCPQLEKYRQKPDKTFAELSSSIKNKISHRARALDNIKHYLSQCINLKKVREL
ncbi:MAG: XTP/dITP diphosphatase [Nitrospirota bacterium]